MIVELILWFQCPAQWEFWQNKAVTHNKLNCDFLVIQKDGSETFSYWLHVQASHRKSLTLALSHHVGWQIVLPCIREVFPSIHVMLGTCFFSNLWREKKRKSKKTGGALSFVCPYEWDRRVKGRSCNESKISKEKKNPSGLNKAGLSYTDGVNFICRPEKWNLKKERRYRLSCRDKQLLSVQKAWGK